MMSLAKDRKPGLGIVEITRQVGISPERLRYWERLGIVRPRYVSRGTRRFRRYSAGDIRRAVWVKALVDIEKYTLGGALRKLEADERRVHARSWPEKGDQT